MRDPILHYRSALTYNREVFLIQQGILVKAFSGIDDNFETIMRPLITERDPQGKSHVSLVPFLLLLQRQARAAFELFSADQAYQGWVVARPGIESALIIGKWVDDTRNATIWKNRNANRAAYRKAYEGQALRSKSLANSPSIQSVLSRINDDFVHPNPDYYVRHLKVGEGDPGYVNVVLDYFDDDAVQEAHLLAFLHLTLFIQEDLANLCAGLFATPVVLPNRLAKFRNVFQARVQPLEARYAETKSILEKFGNWQVP